MAHDANGATLHLTVGGAKHHARCTVLLAEIAREKGWHVRSPYSPGSEGWNPDFWIEKPDSRREGAAKVEMVSVFAIEVIDSSDRVPLWRERNLRMGDVLSFVVSGKTLDEVALMGEAKIP